MTQYTTGGTTTITIGTTTITGGADTQILFNDAGVVGSDAGLTYNKTTDAFRVNIGTTGTFTWTNGTNNITLDFISAGTIPKLLAVSNSTFKFGVNNAEVMGIGASDVKIISSARFGIVTAADTNTVPDVLLSRAAAATWQLGAANAAAPVNQTLQAQGGSGTNIAGAKLTVGAGIGTGNAVPAVVAIAATAMGGASGTTAQTNVDRQIIGATEVLTNNTVTTVVSCTLANNTVGAFKVAYGVEVFDATDVQVEVGEVTFRVTNKGGAIANNVATKYGNSQAVTAGTLTVTWTITAANPALIQVNANSSLTPSAGYPRVTFRLDDLTQQAVVLA